MSAVVFDHVRYHRGEQAVLDDVSFEAAAGEVIALVGRSGAGKSTLLKLVNAMLMPSSGTVEVEGRDTSAWDRIRLRRRIGYVLQEVGLFPHLDVSRNIGLVPSLERWPRERIDARVGELLELIGLPGHGARWPDELSGGERQRIGVARALAADPPVLLMDEPFGALDPISRSDLHREFRAIQARIGKTVLIVTHDMGEAFALADRIGVVDGGRLAALDSREGIAASTTPAVRRLLDSIPCVP